MAIGLCELRHYSRTLGFSSVRHWTWEPRTQKFEQIMWINRKRSRRVLMRGEPSATVMAASP
jgi:hypothetical protein